MHYMQVLPQCNISEEEQEEEQQEEEQDEEPQAPPQPKSSGGLFGRTQKLKADSQVCIFQLPFRPSLLSECSVGKMHVQHQAGGNRALYCKAPDAPKLG